MSTAISTTHTWLTAGTVMFFPDLTMQSSCWGEKLETAMLLVLQEYEQEGDAAFDALDDNKIQHTHTAHT